MAGVHALAMDGSGPNGVPLRDSQAGNLSYVVRLGTCEDVALVI